MVFIQTDKPIYNPGQTGLYGDLSHIRNETRTELRIILFSKSSCCSPWSRPKGFH